jgi:hypothetical protein
MVVDGIGGAGGRNFTHNRSKGSQARVKIVVGNTNTLYGGAVGFPQNPKG